MARFYPQINPRYIGNAGEHAVALALDKAFGSDVWIFHSYPWLRRRRFEGGHAGALEEGEIDFVVLHPKVGLAVLEVKGGRVQREPSGRWSRARRNTVPESIKDPFGQARDGMHVILDLVRETTGRDLPLPYGYAVVLPDVRWTGQVPIGADEAILLDGTHLDSLDNGLLKAMAQWDRRPPDARRPLSRDQLRPIAEAICRRFDLVELPAATIREDEAALAKLTDRQAEALAGISHYRRAAVRGVAGSGKTLLALLRATGYAREEGPTLLLCYNAALAEWLREQTGGDNPSLPLVVRTFHQWALEVLEAAGRPMVLPEGDQNAFWQDEVPDELSSVLFDLDDPPAGCDVQRLASLTRFRALVVDEAQDFKPLWWSCLQILLDPSGGESGGDGQDGAGRTGLYVFHDPDQNIFDGAADRPTVDVEYNLIHNCRNTRLIAAHCGKLIDKQLSLHPEAPSGTAVEHLNADDAEACAATVERIVSGWINEGGLEPCQVAVLSARRVEATPLAGKRSLASKSVVNDPRRWRRGEGILLCTTRAFKGLEASAVVLLDVDPADVKWFGNRDRYVACSRAKHRLTVLWTANG